MSPERNSTRPAYAAHGLIGVLTPQANTTVEAEFKILLPRGFGMVNARLTSSKAHIIERLVDYADTLTAQCRQFGNAPLDTLALAVTGTSYYLGPSREDSLVEQFERDGIGTLVTAARATCAALAALEAKRIDLISPYPDELTQKSVGYWISRGFSVQQVVSIKNSEHSYHPIYALSADASDIALERCALSGADAVVMLGTGLPTLHAIAARTHWTGPPVISCTLALAWQAISSCAQNPPDKDTLEQWIRAQHWRHKLLE